MKDAEARSREEKCLRKTNGLHLLSGSYLINVFRKEKKQSDTQIVVT